MALAGDSSGSPSDPDLGGTEPPHYVNAFETNGKLNEGKVIRSLLAKIRQTCPEILGHDQRDFFLKFWNPPANVLGKGFRSLQGDNPEEVELLESNIALAASLGLTEQFERGLNVAGCLNRLKLEIQHLQANRLKYYFNVDEIVDNLLSIFNQEKREYGQDSPSESDVEKVRKLINYLLFHRICGVEVAAAYAQHVLALKERKNPKSIRTAMIFIITQSNLLVGQLLIKMGRLAEKHSMVDTGKDDLIFGLQVLSRSLTQQLRKREMVP